MTCVGTNCYPDVNVCISEIPLRTPSSVSPTAGLEKQCSSYITQNYGTNPVDSQQMTIGDLTSFWNSNFQRCIGNYNEILFNYTGGKFKYNPDNLPQVQDDFYVLLNSAFGEDLSGFNDTVNTGLQETLLKACKDVPGACDAYLCNKLCPSFSYGFLSNNPAVTDWCGCYITPDNADTLFENITPNQVTPDDERGANPCYPLCHRIETIPLFSIEDGSEYECSTSVCVIDNVTINAVNSSVGNVNITQICPSCSPDRLCECIISSNDLPNTFEELGISASYSSYCGENGQCYVLNPDNSLTPVNCTDYLTNKSSNLTWIYILISLIGVFVILLAIGIFIATKNRKIIEKIPEIPKSKTEEPEEPFNSLDKQEERKEREKREDKISSKSLEL